MRVFILSDSNNPSVCSSVVLSFPSVSFPSPCDSSDLVLRGPGAALGAGHHGTGEAGERAGHLSPGCHALLVGLFLGQTSRSVHQLNLKERGGGVLVGSVEGH